MTETSRYDDNSYNYNTKNVRKGLNIDYKDRLLMTLLESNSSLGQTEIARQMGISQSSIGLRLKKLRKSGLLRSSFALDYSRLGLLMGRIDVGVDDKTSMISWAQKCPLFVDASIGIGDKNVSLFFVAENVEMFRWIVDEHIRRLKGVTDVDFRPILEWRGAKQIGRRAITLLNKSSNNNSNNDKNHNNSQERVTSGATSSSSHHIVLDMVSEREEFPPCGMLPYCPNCPANPNYKGTIWNS